MNGVSAGRAALRKVVERRSPRRYLNPVIAASWLLAAAIFGLADSNFGSWHETRLRYVVMRSQRSGKVVRVAGPFQASEQPQCRAMAAKRWPQAYCVALTAKEVARFSPPATGRAAR
jgi:hypothetical protein